MSLQSQIIRHRHRLISLPAEVSMALTECPLLDKYLFTPRYEQYKQQYASSLSTVNSQDEAILDGLNNRGFFCTNLSQLKLSETSEFVHSADKICEQLEQKEHAKSGITALSFEQLLEYPHFFRWGLQDRFVAIAENYLNTPAAYDTFVCNLSRCNGRETGTRLWHIDHEDRRMIKIIIYLNDVDKNGGPFQFISREATEALIAANKKNHFWTQEQLAVELQNLGFDLEKSTVTCTGAKGTVLFVDTTYVFHRGKPPVESDRKAAFYGYISRRPSQPYRCGRSLFSREQLQIMTQGLTNEQKKSVFWKNELNMFVKFIPRYRYYKL